MGKWNFHSCFYLLFRLIKKKLNSLENRIIFQLKPNAQFPRKTDLSYLHLGFRFRMEELKNMLINLVLDNILEGVQQLLGGIEEVALIRPTIMDAVHRIRNIIASRIRIKGAK